MSNTTTFRRVSFRVFTVVGALTCGLIVLFAIAALVKCGSGTRVATGTVIEIDLDQAFPEMVPSDPLAQILALDAVTLAAVIETLDRAANDDAVSGLVARVGDTSHGFAQTQELRDAVTRFRESGKFAVAYADSFGELGPGNEGYYLATAFDEIWLQPTGAVGLTGLRAEAMFVRGTLDLLGVEPQGDHRREYKNAFNMFSERRYTEAHREASKAIIDDIYGQLVRDIAERRGMSEAEVRSIIDRGPLLGREAVAAKLVDGVAYRDEVLAKVKERAGEDATLLFAGTYRERAEDLDAGDHKIAVVYGVGGVTRGESGFDPLTGSVNMGSDTVAGSLAAAIADDSIEAIVFRVDSPGGSAVASDSIWREVVRAKEAGKPVIVSMGNVAGSGGYYVACAATKIVAQPATITGSIGVLGGKPITRDAWNKIGVTFDSVSTSKNAAMFSSVDRYDEAGWERLQAWLDWVYADFKQKVADGRGMDLDAVETVARGRIWSGERAKSLGLVDALGGMHTAVALAKQELGIEADAPIELQSFPPERDMFEVLLGDSPENSEERYKAAQTRVGGDLARVQGLARRLAATGLLGEEPGVLQMGAIEVGP